MAALLSSATASEYEALVSRVVAAVAEGFRTADQPSSGATRAELSRLVDAVDLHGPGIGNEAALDEIDALFTRHAVWFHHPAYLAHLNCPVALPAVAAETVLAAVNPSVDTWDQSKSGTLIERRLLRWMSEVVGFDGGDGVFTSGGTQSNMHALLLAREAALAGRGSPTTATAPPTLTDLVVFAGRSAHFSVRKACFVLGMGSDAVVPVAEDAHGRLDPVDLAARVDAAISQGLQPMAVIATAGTTDRGNVDPLGAIADVAERTGLWLHVDAAYGCGLLLSPRRRSLVDGIERASSVTVDFHKSFFQPVSSSAVIVRHGDDLTAGRWHADYLNPPEDDEPNQVDVSLQTTRRFDALKLWATVRALGPLRLGQMFDAVVDLAQQVHAELAHEPDVELVGPTDLSTVLFRFRPPSCSDRESERLVPHIRAHLLESGEVHVAKTVVEGRPCLKLTLLNPDTSVEQVMASIQRVLTVGHELLAASGASQPAGQVQ